MAAISIKDDKQLVLLAENKVAGAIYKVIRTTQDDFALACSNGCYFATYEPMYKKFTLQKQVILQGDLLT